MVFDASRADGALLELLVSDPMQLRPLRERLHGIPGLAVSQRPGRPGPGEQGAWDFLPVLASGSGVLGVAIKTLPEFLRSRRTELTITVRARGRELTLTASNLDEVMPIVERLVDGQPDD